MFARLDREGWCCGDVPHGAILHAGTGRLLESPRDHTPGLKKLGHPKYGRPDTALTHGFTCALDPQAAQIPARNDNAETGGYHPPTQQRPSCGSWLAHFCAVTSHAPHSNLPRQPGREPAARSPPSHLGPPAPNSGSQILPPDSAGLIQIASCGGHQKADTQPRFREKTGRGAGVESEECHELGPAEGRPHSGPFLLRIRTTGGQNLGARLVDELSHRPARTNPFKVGRRECSLDGAGWNTFGEPRQGVKTAWTNFGVRHSVQA
ncbi:hypothetical protein F5148DRAFT_1147789 [Russula earlei]|uniref:Uncharacterized protein n=1 Tax=Russula earlei TaxID=71964 RepID=A0ACC0UF06_9AGAM|nr:hypothetical protein F5148DRAFT_1147789 [Russula earlei]